MAALIQGSSMDWTSVGGRAVQVETSMSHFWALSEKNEIMRCRLPCTQKDWWKPVRGTKYKSFSANPFEIWAVNEQNQVHRCRFPCKKATKFHQIAEGFKQVSLGLSEAWAVTGDNRVAKADFEFAKETSPIDHTKLTWRYVGNNIKQVSIGEDGEVWGVRAGKNVQQIIRYVASKNRWENVPGVGKAVDIGVDYIYAISRDNQVMRCLRPCRNGGWELPSSKKVKRISARYNNPGALLAIGKNPEENVIMTGLGAWSQKFAILDPGMPFYRCRRGSVDKGTTLGAFSHYFIPEWHLRPSEQPTNSPSVPF